MVTTDSSPATTSPLSGTSVSVEPLAESVGRVSRSRLFWQQALEIWTKELKSEWRSRYAIGSSALFALTTLVVLSLVVGPDVARSQLAAALLWVVILFSATAGLSHGFAREVEGGTWDLLRQSVGPGPVLLGKWLGAISILTGIVTLVIAVGGILMAPVIGHGLGFGAILALGSLSMGVTLPLVAALLSHARRHGGLMVALVFPLLLPGLLASVSGTRRALEGDWPGGELKVLLAFTGVLVIAGWRLFDFVWND